MSDLGTDAQVGPIEIFTGTEDGPKRGSIPLPLALSPGSRHDGSPRDSTLGCAGEHTRRASMRPSMGMDLHGAGILTGFPFDVLD